MVRSHRGSNPTLSDKRLAISAGGTSLRTTAFHRWSIAFPQKEKDFPCFQQIEAVAAPQFAHSKLWTARSARAGCGLITPGLKGLRDRSLSEPKLAFDAGRLRASRSHTSRSPTP